MGHSQPGILKNSEMNAIRDLASRAVNAVGIENDPAHVEIMLTEFGPKMVELGARMGDDCITTHLVPLSMGIDMVGSTIKIALGEEPDLNQQFDKSFAIRYFNVPCGIITSIKGIEEARRISGVREISFVKSVGDKIDEIGSSTDRLGFVIAQADTPRASDEDL
ncbi:MAG: hypothetical protein ACOYH0_02600 [Saccharofermentanales bacterium]|jgi:biotin carboxylase